MSDFLWPWFRLNLLSLPYPQQKQLVISRVAYEATTNFEYGKMEEGYETEEHLLDQIIKKTPPIAQSLYPVYELLFMFDNAISNSIYAKDALQVTQKNKGPGCQQIFLQAGWYTAPNRELIIQDMSTITINFANGKSTAVQKIIQAILVERKLWPSEDVRLVWDTLKCTTC